MKPASQAITPAAMMPRSNLCASWTAAFALSASNCEALPEPAAGAGAAGGGVAELSGWVEPSPVDSAGVSPCWSVMVWSLILPDPTDGAPKTGAPVVHSTGDVSRTGDTPQPTVSGCLCTAAR